MKVRNVMIFAYDFPHKKTQDFIFRLTSEGYNIKYIIGAPWKKINSQKSTLRVFPVNEGVIHPKKLSKALGIKYLVSSHNDIRTVKYIKNNPVDLYIIGGARILSVDIIDASANNILNIHPGLLPENRGLDTLLWSIYNDIPIGISAHFISSKIDKGRLIYKEKLKLNSEDTLQEVALRLIEKQSDVLVKTISLINRKGYGFKDIDFTKSSYFSKMNSEKEKTIPSKFKKWIKKYSTIKND